jgi:hypothetical protein
MEQFETIPSFVSFEELCELYVSNHKNLTKEDIDLNFEKNKIEFLKILTYHFVEYNFNKKYCLIIKDVKKLISLLEDKKINHLLNEYLINLNGLSKKQKKFVKIVIIPFDQEKDLISFLNLINLITSLDFDLWKFKKTPYDEVEY